MAVEILFLSVVLRKASMLELSLDQCDRASRMFAWEPTWIREDAQLVATSFMCPADVRRFGMALESCTGLHRDRDWTVVDMLLGVLSKVPWLKFRGGPGELTGAWLEGSHPGELARVPSVLPGKSVGAGQVVHFMNGFGRDSRQDPEEHLADFGTVIPAWGGTSLWMAAVSERGQSSSPKQIDWLSYDASAVDFMSLGSSGDAVVG